MEPARPALVERRLPAILAADVAEYSRLIGADEEGTLGRLRALCPRARLTHWEYFADGMFEKNL
jgi:class 3 adenylate cyclase